MLDARNHLQYDYPLSGVHLRRFEAVKEAEDAKRAEQERKAAEEEEAARIAEEVCGYMGCWCVCGCAGILMDGL